MSQIPYLRYFTYSLEAIEQNNKANLRKKTVVTGKYFSLFLSSRIFTI